MRILAVASTAVLALLMAGAANAVATLTFEWSSTGTDTVAAGVGDTVTMDIIVSSDTLLGAGVSVVWDPAKLEAQSATECPSPPNLAVGLCSIGTNFFNPLAQGVVIDNDTGQISSFDAYKTPPGVDGAFTLGRVVFLVEGGLPATVDSFYIPGLDSLNDLDNSQGTNGVWMPAESATIVPEPSTLGLLALGLGALGALGRRR